MQHLTESDVERIAAAVIAKLAAGSTPLPHSQASNIAAAAARTTVQEMMVRGMAMVGIDIANSKEIAALKADIAFARGLRLKMDRVGQSMTTAITNAVTYGILVLLVIGFFWWMRGQGLPPKGPPLSK